MMEGKILTPEIKKLIAKNKDKITESQNITYNPTKIYENKFIITNVKIIENILDKK